MVGRLIGFDEVEEFVCISVNRENEKECVIGNGKFRCHYIKENQVDLKPNLNLTAKLQKIIDKEMPDIIDVQGAEFSIPADFLNCSFKCPAVITLQGFPFEIAKVYNLGVPKAELLFGRSFHDCLHFSGLIERKFFIASRGKRAKNILESFDYALGRTSWDKSVVLGVNPDIKYYKCNRILREDFYGYKWNLEKVESHKIFGIQGNVPAKGLHIALKVLGILKEKYPDVKLVVPGVFNINEKPLKMSSYTKYIKKLIKKYGVADNIELVGKLNPAEMINEEMSSRVFLQYSLQENSPNSLAEAQTMGLPCVASSVGGTVDYIEHGKTGLLYDCTDAESCAKEIADLFENDELAVMLSDAGQKAALERHDGVKNSTDLIFAYHEIINDFNDKKQ